jgi:hypothetical protein
LEELRSSPKSSANGAPSAPRLFLPTRHATCTLEQGEVARSDDEEASMFDTASIHEHMVVLDNGGNRIGRVDRVEGHSIKLTKDTPAAHGEHRYIPLEWVERVDDSVHLDKDSGAVEAEWLAAPVGAGGG